MILNIFNTGAVGVIKDVKPHLLPPEAWTDAKNIRFVDAVAVKMGGASNLFGAHLHAPLWTMPSGGVGTMHWMYSSLTKMSATDGSTHADITRTSGGNYSTTNDHLWHGGVLGGIPVITNGADVPQFWGPADLTTPLANLTNWPSNDRCQIIRPFKNFLIALSITRSGVVLPHRVKWSHPADPGTLPASWDYTDPTYDAGERDLDDAEFGGIVDGVALGDTFIIYKERAIWGMQFIGGIYIWRFFPIFDTFGALTAGAVTRFSAGRQHFVPTGEDIIVHNGQEHSSILDARWRKFLLANIEQSMYKRCFSVANPIDKEVWFCFPSVGATWANMAMVWNIKDGSISVRDLPGGVSHIAYGPIPGSVPASTWDSDSDSWDSDTTVWDIQTIVGYQARLVQCSILDSVLQQLETTEQNNGQNMEVYLERQGLAVIGRDRGGQPKADINVRKLMKRIWPKVSGGPVNVRIGMQETLNDPVTWMAPKQFDPSSGTKFLDFIISGRLIAVRFETNSNVTWQLDGYDLEFEVLGAH